MSEIDVIPELKEIVGAMLFAAKKPLTAGDIRRVLRQVGEGQEGPAADFGTLKTKDVQAVIDGLIEEVKGLRLGFGISEVANGYRLENEVRCGPWLRQLLDKGRATRLSRPALETLAIIAYRQPCVRSEIEQVRGVAVDQIIRNLLEMQLVRVVGRSELPGRPWLFGTTQKFLEHFGLNSVDDMPAVEELRKLGELNPMKKGAADDDEEDDEDRDEDDDEAGGEEAAIVREREAPEDPESWVKDAEKDPEEDPEADRIDLAGGESSQEDAEEEEDEYDEDDDDEDDDDEDDA